MDTTRYFDFGQDSSVLLAKSSAENSSCPAKQPSASEPCKRYVSSSPIPLSSREGHDLLRESSDTSDPLETVTLCPKKRLVVSTTTVDELSGDGCFRGAGGEGGGSFVAGLSENGVNLAVGGALFVGRAFASLSGSLFVGRVLASLSGSFLVGRAPASLSGSLFFST